jgi:hypothetical protein
VRASLTELLGAHPSAIRQFATIGLERLSWDGRWEIVIAAAGAFNGVSHATFTFASPR